MSEILIDRNDGGVWIFTPAIALRFDFFGVEKEVGALCLLNRDVPVFSLSEEEWIVFSFRVVVVVVVVVVDDDDGNEDNEETVSVLLIMLFIVIFCQYQSVEEESIYIYIFFLLWIYTFLSLFVVSIFSPSFLRRMMVIVLLSTDTFNASQFQYVFQNTIFMLQWLN